METLLSPDQRDWSRKGVYAYWDRRSHDILYLGLAADLPTRFAQHNGLVRHSGGNKTREIDEYFARNERLGFTVLIQSKAIVILEQIAEISPLMGTTANRLITVGEGQLIEAHKLVHDTRPPWNRQGGSKDGRRWATPARALLDVLAVRRESLFAARRGLRELAGDLRARLYESTIHAARMRAVLDAHEVGRFPGSSEGAVRAIKQFLMVRDGHLVDELDASDDEIRLWLKLLGDPDYWEEEVAFRQAMFELPTSYPRSESDRKALEFLDSVVAGGPEPLHIAETQAILETGYLDQEVILL